MGGVPISLDQSLSGSAADLNIHVLDTNLTTPSFTITSGETAIYQQSSSRLFPGFTTYVSQDDVALNGVQSVAIPGVEAGCLIITEANVDPRAASLAQSTPCQDSSLDTVSLTPPINGASVIRFFHVQATDLPGEGFTAISSTGNSITYFKLLFAPFPNFRSYQSISLGPDSVLENMTSVTIPGLLEGCVVVTDGQQDPNQVGNRIASSPACEP